MRDDRGAVAANAAVLGAAFMLFFLVVQTGLWFYGRTVLTSAAHHGLDAARVQSGTAEDGEEIAAQFLEGIGGVESFDVVVERTEEQVTVEVEAAAITILPFLSTPRLAVDLEGPVERPVEAAG